LLTSILSRHLAIILMSIGMMMLPPVMISLPFKLIFFVLVDGWYLVAGNLTQSHRTIGSGPDAPYIANAVNSNA
jgi:hypothetical protein